MEVILTQDVNGIGKTGSVIKVKDGFARNFLFPGKLAVLSTAGNMKSLELERQKKNLQMENLKKEAEKIRDRLQNLSLTIPVLTQDKEKLYGSISAADLQNVLKEENIDIDKNNILLEEPIKALGIYEIPVNLHPEISAKIKVWIVKK
ncbi:MAG: 50S ribosomal protein L9 [Candidatus Omnitrophica bacterium]|nr:50S ribosomal protein L9 [Candidatus Omnitrophota bacterium]